MRKKFIPLLVLLTALTGLGPAACAKSQPQATQTSVPSALGLQPKPKESLVDEKIAGIMDADHYGKRPLNDKLSRDIFDLYIKGLDPNKSYFIAKDISSFKKRYATELDNAIKAGNLQPAFHIYDVYEHRVKQRIAYTLKLLKHKPNFSIKANYLFDRSDAHWAPGQKALNAIWRKKIKNEAIGFMLTGKTWKQTAKKLKNLLPESSPP